MDTYKLIEQCLCCGSSKLFRSLDLGYQPPPNGFTKREDIASVPKFPLETRVCERCFHSQLGYEVLPSLLFNNSYVYRTGVSKTLVDYYNQFAKDAVAYWDVDGQVRSKILATTNINDGGDMYLKLELHARVLDIGCNDGTLLAGFKKVMPNCITAGVDMAQIDGIQKHAEVFFNAPWESSFLASHPVFAEGRMDIITATNVLAHTPNPRDFVMCCGRALKQRSGVVIFEFPYGGNVIKNLLFDTIYHEHYSYFLVKTFVQLLQNTGLYVAHVMLNSIHGGSVRFYCRTCRKGNEQTASMMACRFLIDEERAAGLHDDAVYLRLQDRLENLKKEFVDVALKNAIMHHRVKPVGFGASGKSTVMLNYFDIDLGYIVDETPGKQGLFSPGKSIPIVHPFHFTDDPLQRPIVIMSWNCMQESISKCRSMRQWEDHGSDGQDTILTYLPNVSSRNTMSL